MKYMMRFAQRLNESHKRDPIKFLTGLSAFLSLLFFTFEYIHYHNITEAFCQFLVSFTALLSISLVGSRNIIKLRIFMWYIAWLAFSTTLFSLLKWRSTSFYLDLVVYLSWPVIAIPILAYTLNKRCRKLNYPLEKSRQHGQVDGMV
jgi:phosphatidylserine synthase